MTIASYIAQDLESRMRSGDGLPDKLTLGGLAEQYGVSFTPVRVAIRELIDRELLIKKSNGRLAVNADGISGSGKRESVPPPVPPKDWDAILGDEVLLLSLRGEAVFLREEAVAERHGIGRTLLRQAFGRLAGRGLLEHVPRCGWKVRPFREDDMITYLDVRETLELKALDLARPRLVAVDLERMLAGNVPAENANPPRLDNQLHRYFIDRSENRYIKEFFASHGGYYTALFDYAALGASVVKEMAEQHREILSHALARRWAKARKALAHHIRSQQPVSLELIRIMSQHAVK